MRLMARGPAALLALGLLAAAPVGVVGAGPPSCHLGGCAADLEAGSGGALSLLQAEGAKAEPFATLVQVHSQVLETAKRLVSGSKVKGTFDILIVLPVLGFIATLLAIGATVIVEQRAMSVAQRLEGSPGAGGRSASPRAGGDLLLSPGNVYKGLRSLLHGETPPACAGSLGRARKPGAEALLPSAPAGATAGSLSPSFGEQWGQVALPQSQPGTPGHFVGEFKSQGAAVETIMVMRPMEDGRLGLKLTDDTLEITDFSDPRAQAYGFQIGDRILQVNSVAVSQRDDFMAEVARALELNRSRGAPIHFLAVRQPRAGPPAPAPAPRTRAPLAAAPPPAAGLAAPPAPLPEGRGLAPAEGAAADAPPIPTSSSAVLAKNAPMLGSWVYSDDTGDYNYQISREASGLLLRFSQQLPSGAVASGSLSELEEGWHQGTLSMASGMRHGTIRLRYDARTGEMVSLLKLQGDNQFGDEVRSHRLEAPASLSPPASATAAAPLMLPFASAPTSPASLQAYDPPAPPQTG